MATTQVDRARQHVAAGQRFMVQERWQDAAAEFTLAIRASAPRPNSEALRGRAIATLRSDASVEETDKAFAEARPYIADSSVFWSNYIRYFLGQWARYDNRSPDKRSQSILRDVTRQRDIALDELDRGIARFKEQLRSGHWDTAADTAGVMVRLADWMDGFELESWIGRTVFPLRDYAPRLYRAVAESDLQAKAPADLDPESKEHLDDEVIGRARRQLVYRGNDTVVTTRRSSESAQRSIPIWGWIVGAVVEVILLATVWWLALLIALGVGGFVFYRKTRA